ncbi:MAG: DNA polymerase III subunit delta' [Porticoccaceae bacterium]|nr:DNA polymerase III subunit delta' [Porticoccaceae bacterium]MDG1475322.1 DNA polymerase III subunit delta' [Porticoccaceae bacterium]
MSLSLISLPLPWHTKIWDDFNQTADVGRVPHALLISGPNGMGKMRLATGLAQRLLCLDTLNGIACGVCKGCQLLASGFHPDLTIVQPADTGKDIIINEVRTLCTTLSKTSQQGGWKIAIIAPAESMNISAANALLKSLEEPQDKTLLILVSHRPSLLPATIRSRCQKILVPHPDRLEARQWLSEVSGQDPRAGKALDVATGRPLLALEYLQAGVLKDQQLFEELLRGLQEGSQSGIYAAEQVSKLNMVNALEWFIAYLHAIVVKDQSLQSNQNVYLFFDRLNHTHRMVLSGSTVNQQLLWEELFMSWRQVFSHR